MMKVNNIIKKSLISLSAASMLLTFATSLNATSLDRSVDGAVKYKDNGNKWSVYYINPQRYKVKYNSIGRSPTKDELKEINIDVMPDGTGLPEGEGTVDEGEELFDKHCAMCHGDFGSGGKGYPPLSGGEHSSLKNQLLDPEAGDEPPIKTIGTYWPYATTLFWYVKTGMPFPHPMTLTNDEAYAITAYLLNVNEVTFKNGDDIEKLNKELLLQVDMPNKDGFYPDVDKEGPKAMTKFMSDPYNMGTMKYPQDRCMHNCIKGKVPVVRIKNELSGFKPALSTVRDLPKDNGGAKKVSEGEKIYNETCSACHGNPAIGAPVVGDKDAWAKVLKQDINTIYNHAINGFNAMPPKGGNMDLTDEQVKKTVDYMIEKSK